MTEKLIAYVDRLRVGGRQRRHEDGVVAVAGTRHGALHLGPPHRFAADVAPLVWHADREQPVVARSDGEGALRRVDDAHAVDESRPRSRIAARTGISTMSTPIGSFARLCSASSVAILSATSSAIPAAGLNAPRSVEMPALARFSPSSQGLKS